MRGRRREKGPKGIRGILRGDQQQTQTVVPIAAAQHIHIRAHSDEQSLSHSVWGPVRSILGTPQYNQVSNDDLVPLFISVVQLFLSSMRILRTQGLSACRFSDRAAPS